MPLLSRPVAFPEESFGQISAHGKTFISGLLEADVAKRFHIEDALRHAWLQPVRDESVREELSLAVPDSAIERRQARVSAVARRRLRVSALKVMALRRLSDPSVSAEELREALQSRASKEGVAVVPPSKNALQAHEEAHREHEAGKPGGQSHRRRLSEYSTVSYKSDDMAPRTI